ncbi:histidinol dehydrogenase [Rhodococcus sp. (in: high G+C Gram-positive bacteria)]|uniref:histidinol dehydrogenase n=1 Tax=Rhodococcus sp. TaxID=1831 RepID=UPI00257C1338|nr:histidinol dehydrogenase [Rhodococcus sp. (in: high G+C Gram-positive bacteria)]MBQ7803121.1 histidinol dehydrogenase [Rhodococcus sp. (in: high G+C Gram-positive bacteria)]
MTTTETSSIKISTIDLRGTPAIDIPSALPRAEQDIDAVLDRVRPIIEQVRRGSATTLLDLAEQFDGVRPPALRVPPERLTEALASLDPEVRSGLEESISRARMVHTRQRRIETVVELSTGATVTDTWLPVTRVGLYVPGGKAVYPSSVIMNVVPAQEAHVASLAIASPPQKNHGGWPHPTVLAAAALLGVNEVYAAGGAQAIAMFAYGVRDVDGTLVCAPVSMVTGPGNVYVAAAKRTLRGVVGIDAEAGPTEVAILADETADATCVAADLISQAEHDPLAAAVLVTSSTELCRRVQLELNRQAPKTKHFERVCQSLAGRQSGIVLVDDLTAGIEVVNHYGAEHLEIQTANPRDVARRITNAGAIFVGKYAPVSLGDYCAGSNHVLPTGGSSAHSSGLSVQTFLRGIQVIDYDRGALQEVKRHVVALAFAEDLPAHGQAIAARFGTDDA